jgi:uracil-xanthine permease
MAAATLLVPALTGLPASTTLLFSGIGTLLSLLLTRNRLPAYLGSSFAFVAPLQAAYSAGVAAQLGGVLVAGIVLTAVGIAIKALGPRVVELLMPPVVAGAVVMLLGLSLARGVIGWITAQPGVAALTVVVVIAMVVLLGGDAGRLAVLIGLATGWMVATLMGRLDPARVDALAAAGWIGVPELTSPQISPAVALATLPVVIVLIVESIGNLKAIGAVTDRPVDRLAGDTLVAVGLGTTLAGLGGGTGASIRPENVGVLAASRVYSSAAVLVAALAAIVLSASPKVTALLMTVPVGVLGGAGFVLFVLIGIAGAKVWIDNHVELTDPVTLLVGAVALIAGIGVLTITVGDVLLGGFAWGSIAIVLLYLLLRVVRWVLTDRGSAAALRRRPGMDPG